MDGINYFHPRNIKKNTEVGPLLLTDFMLFHNSIEPDTFPGSTLHKSITYETSINLRYDQNTIGIEFALVDLLNPLKNKYAYKLDGIDPEWVNTEGRERVATYTRLDPGEYTFHLKGANYDGVWNKNERTLGINILPPWWRTNLAYIAYVTLLVLIIYVIWKSQINRIRLKHQLEIKSIESQKSKELDTLKSTFFSNISHEFRTPLTLIEGPVNQLLRGEFQGNVKEAYKLVIKNTRRLLNLVNQLLDLSKLEAGRLKLQVTRQNIVPLLSGLVQSFESLARRKNIEYVFNKPENDIELYIDTEKFEKIIINLLSNAFKFTPDEGKITVNVNDTPGQQTDPNFLEISIHNTGKLI